MRNATLVMMAFVTLALTGCALAPQTIRIQTQPEVKGRTHMLRDALVRTVDERPQDTLVLGTRGGIAPERSPLLSDRPLSEILTADLQRTLKKLGFGQGGSEEPLKVQLTVQKFYYRCKESAVVNECGIEIRFLMTVIDGGRTFSKPYGINEVRSLASSPVTEYNELWVSDVLSRVWQYIFNDPEFRQALGVM